MRINPFYLAGRLVTYAKEQYADGLAAYAYVTSEQAAKLHEEEIVNILRTHPVWNRNDGSTVGGYIQGIKKYRQDTGKSLKEAKDYVDSLMVKYNLERL